MLDIKFIRENKELIAEAAKKKFSSFSVDELLTVDDKRKMIMASIEKKRAEQNAASVEIGKAIAMTNDPKEREDLVLKMRIVKGDVQKEETELKEVMTTWQKLMLQVPNIPDMSVPVGESDNDNLEIKKVGEPAKFDFKPKTHTELMEALDMVDLARGAKVAGFRGYFLKNDGALLNYALWNFVNAEFHKKGGWTPMLVPSLLNKQTFMGTGYLPQGEEDLYKTQDETYLAGTAEVGTMGYYMDEILDAKQLPIKFFSFSPAYRREAGSHGKDTKGIFRVHEFFKFEQVILCEANHETSVKHHEELLANVEDLMQKLNLPYHVVVNCTGDLGLGQVKKYDVEAWMPSENRYRETHSCSYFHDFQTRRLNTRYKDADGKMRFAHSLNNTALANTRMLVAIIENNQQADGTIRIPEALVPFMYGKKVIEAPKK